MMTQAMRAFYRCDHPWLRAMMPPSQALPMYLHCASNDCMRAADEQSAK